MSASALIDFPPRFPIGAGFEALNNWLRSSFGWFFDGVRTGVSWSVSTLEDFFVDPGAGQLTVIAVLLLLVPLLRVWRGPATGVIVAGLVLFLGQALFELGNVIINGLPPFLFLWAMNLFGQSHVEAYFVIPFALLIVTVVLLVLRRGQLRAREWRNTLIVTGGWLVTIILGWLVFPVLVEDPRALLMLLLLSALALVVAGWGLAVFAVVALFVVAAVQQWDNAMASLSLVLVASLIAVVIAIPIGVLAAYKSMVSKIVKPILDLMQTMPQFVYLIPAIFFFSIGSVPGVVATVVFAMPPGVRLTELGIRQIDKELVEAGEAFGAPQRKILTGIQLPLAMPTIMAGVNQVIMLSLSMVVIAGMVGAGGLGSQVYQGISRNDGALGFEAGIAVVVLAIFLDRLTAAVTKKSPRARAEGAAA